MKQFKIIVCVATEEAERRRMIQSLAVKLGLAVTQSDAAKMIRPTPYDFEINDTYFLLALTFNFRQSANTVHQLYRMAASGQAVIVGVRKLQAEYEFICETYYQGDII